MGFRKILANECVVMAFPVTGVEYEEKNNGEGVLVRRGE